MAKILPRLFNKKISRSLQIPTSTCYPALYSTPSSNTIRKYDFIRREKTFCSAIFKPVLWTCRSYSDENSKKNIAEEHDSPKPTLFQRFKSMYKDYWYVLIPVHVVTSIGWFGGFYYMARSGVDIISLLETLNVNEKFINSMRDSHMGYLAIAYGCYKIATPARYTITLGGTTISINYLKKWGYIKPVPSAEKLKQMYQEKRDNFDRSMREKKDDLIAKKDELIAKREEFKSKLDDHLEQGIHKIEKLKGKADKVKQKAENILKDKK
ncbi:hypothetical protein HHI36_006073 [Cryptolaemus montrouzieri]|uniref:DUF1279 domain-containing protein n=1 Tax=Cryptolaemus montrouzieri TaxID=559131 RepID=A0ABD2NW82_9CUCU